MKKLFTIFLILITFQLQAQDHYEKAYEYLNNCKNLRLLDKKICKRSNSSQFPINVIEEIYPISILVFNQKIVKSCIMPNSDINEPKLNIFNTKFDQNNYFEPYIDSSISSNFRNNNKSQIYVGFSKLINNMLFAELAYNLDISKKVESLTDITRFNKALAVLFIFNENGEIIAVKMCTNHYD